MAWIIEDGDAGVSRRTLAGAKKTACGLLRRGKLDVALVFPDSRKGKKQCFKLTRRGGPCAKVAATLCARYWSGR